LRDIFTARDRAGESTLEVLKPRIAHRSLQFPAVLSELGAGKIESIVAHGGGEVGGSDLYEDLVDLLQILGCTLGLNRCGLISECGDDLDILRDFAGDIDIQAGIDLQATIVADGDPARDTAVLVKLCSVIDLFNAFLTLERLTECAGCAENALNKGMTLFDCCEGVGGNFVLQTDFHPLRNLIDETDLAFEIIEDVLVPGQGLMVKKDTFGVRQNE